MLRQMMRRSFSTAAEAPKRELSRRASNLNETGGRTSLRTHFFSNRKDGVVKMWWNMMDPSAYPVLAAIVFGVSLAAWFGTRHLIYSPDVKIDKVQRTKTIRENHDEGKAWVQHHASIRGKGLNPKEGDEKA